MQGRKSTGEMRAERITWFLLVLVIAILTLIPEGTIPNPVVPFAGAIIMLGSGVYQYARKWRVSPITWIAGAIMLVLGLYNQFMNQEADLLGAVLLAFVAVIGFGVLTNET